MCSLNDQASDDRVKHGIDSANPFDISEWRGHLRKTGQIEHTLWRGLKPVLSGQSKIGKNKGLLDML